ncbi:MAG TPA: S8 family serine peptidase [Clostridia bacterium]|nr:S8 family serine peptidase [Clostridia bacterium]
MKKILPIMLILSLIFITACSSQATKSVSVMNFQRGSLKTLPAYNADKIDPWQVDLRGYDLRSLNLKDRLDDLLYADFDTNTRWPEDLPEGFNPEEIMDLGKNPGLGLKSIHSKGITGKGVGIAIIDQTLLTEHIEYKDRLKSYEAINNKGNTAEMHGAAVSSIAVGKTVGVAPEANLYYIALTPGEMKQGSFKHDFTWMAKAVDRVIEMNKTLPANERIRVISISLGWSPEKTGYKEINEAIKRAKAENIFVVSCSLSETYGLKFDGLGRGGFSDPESKNSYLPGSWWAKGYFDGKRELAVDTLLVPMDSRTTASPTGKDDYAFYRSGGWSWSVPYIAGLYVLACQVKPDIDPETFWNSALSTGDVIQINHDGESHSLGKVINPVKLFESFKAATAK